MISIVFFFFFYRAFKSSMRFNRSELIRLTYYFFSSHHFCNRIERNTCSLSFNDNQGRYIHVFLQFGYRLWGNALLLCDPANKSSPYKDMHVTHVKALKTDWAALSFRSQREINRSFCNGNQNCYSFFFSFSSIHSIYSWNLIRIWILNGDRVENS